MIISFKRFQMCFLLCIFLHINLGIAQSKIEGVEEQTKEKATVENVPKISEIIPLESELENQFLENKNSVGELVDVEYINKEYKKVENYLKNFSPSRSMRKIFYIRRGAKRPKMPTLPSCRCTKRLKL